ncbi:MAG TPA: DUF1707 domain-containing protein [Streptosporangiaceae bacterium]|jgi:hypothetical protein
MQLAMSTSPGNPPPGSYPPGPGFPAGGRAPNPAIRASDADRDRVLAQLSSHYQDGRLTTAEFDERSSQALAARTMGDLAGLLTDLPAGPASTPVSTAAPGPPPAVRHGAGVGVAIMAVLAVVAVIALLSHAGHGAGGTWGLIVPAVIIWRVLARRQHHHDGSDDS